MPRSSQIASVADAPGIATPEPGAMVLAAPASPVALGPWLRRRKAGSA